MKLSTKKIVAHELLILIGLLLVASIIFLVTYNNEFERAIIKLGNNRISSLNYELQLKQQKNYEQFELKKIQEKISEYRNEIRTQQNSLHNKRHQSIIIAVIVIILLRCFIFVIQWSIKTIRKKEV